MLTSRAHLVDGPPLGDFVSKRFETNSTETDPIVIESRIIGPSTVTLLEIDRSIPVEDGHPRFDAFLQKAIDLGFQPNQLEARLRVAKEEKATYHVLVIIQTGFIDRIIFTSYT